MGSIWKVNDYQNCVQVVKVTAKHLHINGISIGGKRSGNKIISVDENIVKEAEILCYISRQSDCPKCIVKHEQLYESAAHFMLAMEDAGTGLFKFVKKAHALIEHEKVMISEWHQTIKHIFKQMIEAVEYIHALNICHFDISLENFTISNVQIVEKQNIDKTKSISFLLDSIQATLIDFGLSEYFPSASFESSKYCGKQLYYSPEVQLRKGYFNARSNDVYALGVCLFCMTLGISPYRKPEESDELFCWLIRGDLKEVLRTWNKLRYIDDDWLNLMNSIFQYEGSRIDLKGIKEHAWLRK